MRWLGSDPGLAIATRWRWLSADKRNLARDGRCARRRTTLVGRDPDEPDSDQSAPRTFQIPLPFIDMREHGMLRHDFSGNTLVS
jgi:hypothetical protein